MDLWILAGVPLTSFVVALSGALMPGPLLTVTVGEATRRGFWAGPLIILGHGILEMALVLLILAGVGSWLIPRGSGCGARIVRSAWASLG